MARLVFMIKYCAAKYDLSLLSPNNNLLNQPEFINEYIKIKLLSNLPK